MGMGRGAFDTRPSRWRKQKGGAKDVSPRGEGRSAGEKLGSDEKLECLGGCFGCARGADRFVWAGTIGTLRRHQRWGEVDVTRDNDASVDPWRCAVKPHGAGVVS
jgi:hypothetical protein